MRDHSFNRLQSIRIICSTTLNSVAAVIRQCAPCRIAQARLSACLSRLLLRPLVAWRRVHTRTAASRTDIKDNHGYILVPTFGQSPQTETRLKKLIRIWRALHEYVILYMIQKKYTGPYLQRTGLIYGRCDAVPVHVASWHRAIAIAALLLRSTACIGW